MSDVEYPQNDFTRMVERVASGNRSGEFAGRGLASAMPLPAVQSADLGREVPSVPPPGVFAPGEKEELDRLAREAGVVDERLGAPDPDAQYGSIEDAIAAGAPVNPPPMQDPFTMRVPVGTTAQMRGRATLVPTVPDFNRIEGIDLVDGNVVINGMAFPLKPEKVIELKRLVIETAQQAIMEKMLAAMAALSPPATPE